MATHSCIVAGEISGTREAAGLWSTVTESDTTQQLISSSQTFWRRVSASLRPLMPTLQLVVQASAPGTTHSQPSPPCHESEEGRVCLPRGYWLGGQPGGKRSWEYSASWSGLKLRARLLVKDPPALDLCNLLKFAKINKYIFKHLENAFINEKDSFK